MAFTSAWTHKYEAYWNSINKYNRWFIQLRFGAVIGLLVMLLFTRVTNYIVLSDLQFIVVSLTTLFILLCNLIFKHLSDKNSGNSKFNELEFSLFQMLLDLLCLNILFYFTGGIETPFIFFYIFHMIIGSMILPVGLVYVIAGLIMVFLFSFSMLEYAGFIPHQELYGLLSFQFYGNLPFICGYLFILGFVLFTSIVLTSKIAQELYKRELELKKALEELEAAEKTKQKYVMTIVHELKSPISASVSILDSLLGGFYGPVEGVIKEKLERIRFRIGDSIDNINNILRLSRFKLLSVIDKELFDLSEVIEKLVDNQKPVAEKKKITIHTSLEKAEINGDKTLLQLSLSNIINNAIKYTGEEGLIEISLVRKDSSLMVEVADNGLGIPKKDLPKIFEEFYRASNVKEKNIEGTGTGLSIIKQIVETHGGSISIESPSRLASEGKPGSLFRVILPL
jgi:signal transduction histidine kinase